MDKTEQYIKMCEKAELEHEMQVGDCYIHKANNDLGLITHRYNKDTGKVEKEDLFQFRNLTRKCNSYDLIPSHIVWLPRQDQLQEIINYEYPCILIGEFHRWFTDIFIEKHFDLDRRMWTLEQLWLGHTMYKVFNKVWDGVDWVVA